MKMGRKWIEMSQQFAQWRRNRDELKLVRANYFRKMMRPNLPGDLKNEPKASFSGAC
jgi:hypothetical protein